jgi:predicted Zn-dependent peptidase
MSVAVTRLPTGLTVVADQLPHLQTASLGVWVGSGSRDEEKNEHGIAHLLEHMAFKGTSRRSARQIAEEIEAVGGDLNAATSVESTVYYARVLKADVPLALDILSDILSDPAFAPDELAREQNVILQEIGATEDTPDDLVFEFLQGTAFPNQSVGRSILGTPQSVKSFSGGNLQKYLTRNYRGPEMVVAATGAIEHEAVVAAVEKLFGQFNGPEAPMPEPARFHGGARVETRDLEQVHIAIAMEGVPQKDPSLYSLQVFTNVLAAACLRGFQEARGESRAVLHDFGFPHAIFRHWDVGIYAMHRCGRPERADTRCGQRDRVHCRQSY